MAKYDSAAHPSGNKGQQGKKERAATIIRARAEGVVLSEKALLESPFLESNQTQHQKPSAG